MKNIVITTIILTLIILSGCSNSSSKSLFEIIGADSFNKVKELKYYNSLGDKYSSKNENTIKLFVDILKSIKVSQIKEPKPITGYSTYEIIGEKLEYSISFVGDYIKLNNMYYTYKGDDDLTTKLDTLKKELKN
jgi:hypothetical protein